MSNVCCIECAAEEMGCEGGYLGEEVKARRVVAAAVHGVHRKEAVGRLDEEAAQALQHAQ